MAKKTEYPSYALFIAGSVLMAAGWMMASFPLVIFLGLAPLFALTDRTTDTSFIWEKMEWVLLALFVSFLGARAFDMTAIVSSMLYAILFTLPFAGYVWARNVLGKRAGKITIILFWLSLEYILLKINPSKSVFLADALRLQLGWMKWNSLTGFLGASLWILLVNLLVYQTLLSREPFQWYWILLTVIFLVGPILYSVYTDLLPISREDMVAVYSGEAGVKDVAYLARTELVVRSATWLSTLILLFTFVKHQTTK